MKKVLKAPRKLRSPCPKKIQIGFRKYKIVPSKETDTEAITYSGCCDRNASTIELADSSMGDDERKVTLFHEFWHAYIYDIGFNAELTSKKEEQLCQLFSAGVMELIRKNWAILEWAHKEEDI